MPKNQIVVWKGLGRVWEGYAYDKDGHEHGEEKYIFTQGNTPIRSRSEARLRRKLQKILDYQNEIVEYGWRKRKALTSV